MTTEIVSRLYSRQKRAEYFGNSFQSLDVTRQLIRICRRTLPRPAHTRIYVDICIGHEDEDRCATVIPKLPMKFVDTFSGDPFNQLKVDKRRMVSTQHAIQFEHLEGTSEQVRLRRRRIQLF